MKQKSLAIIIGGDNTVFQWVKVVIKEKLDEIFEIINLFKYITTKKNIFEVESLINEYNFDL